MLTIRSNAIFGLTRRLLTLIAIVLTATTLVAVEAAPVADAAAAEAAPAVGDGRPQLRNLADKPAGPRFALPADRVWPAKPGEADICLWDGDRFAALSITVDDNWATDHDWWVEQTSKHGQKMTWFVITGRVGTGGLWGTWEGFKALRDKGYQVQSHTVTHLHVDDAGWPGIESEYTESAKHIEAGIKDHQVITLAYPGGKNSSHNDRTVAAKYYIAGRGVVGTPNAADRIDYMNTNSIGSIDRSRTDSILFGKSDIAWMGGNKYLRGWLCTHFHGVPKPEQREAVAEQLAYIKSVENDLWMGLFEDVVRYGQQRDTATLKVTENTPQRIRFTLSDKMDDKLFDYPLTIKVRLHDDWAAASAVQGDKPVEVKLVTHDGGKFALVKAVPDRGDVTLTPAAK